MSAWSGIVSASLCTASSTGIVARPLVSPWKEAARVESTIREMSGHGEQRTARRNEERVGGDEGT